MGGFFGTISKRDCVMDVFFGTDYHSHLGTKRGGMAVYDAKAGFQRQIHNIENTPFRTKFDKDLADSDAMAYELDRTDDMWALADYVEKGIEVLDNDKGFFMMCEGGKIDWACHANDAASSIHDTKALADAVQVAIDFAEEHPDETLILVTGDHETGGLTIGFAGTDYDTYLDLLESQKISFAELFSSDTSEKDGDSPGWITLLYDLAEKRIFGSIEETDRQGMIEILSLLYHYKKRNDAAARKHR